MVIKTVNFVTSIATSGKYTEIAQTYSCPEVCVLGRSNVGKSSFINMLANRNKLAKTSSTPGRTRLINLFAFNDDFMLVDLPGYGFAEASKGEKDKWQGMIEGYLQNSDKLKQAIVLVDARHKPSAQDEQMLQYLYFYQIPFTIIATKIDKISKNELFRNLQVIATTLKVGKDDIIPISSQTKFNRDKILARFDEVLSL